MLTDLHVGTYIILDNHNILIIIIIIIIIISRTVLIPYEPQGPRV